MTGILYQTRLLAFPAGGRLVVRLLLCSLALAMFLAACVPDTRMSKVGDLKILDVDVVIEITQEYVLGIAVPTENNFPPSEIGLSKSKIISDYARALRSTLIPASATGTRPVNVRVAISGLRLPKTGQSVSPANDYASEVRTYVDITDARTKEKIVSQQQFITLSRETGHPFNYKNTLVQDYNLLLSRFAADLKAGILQ